MWASVLEGSTVDADVTIGPFSHVRKGAYIGPNVELGNYAEVKNSNIGAGTKSHHFSYLGDADVGEKVNIGAGTITANYDGVAKHRTRIGNGRLHRLGHASCARRSPWVRARSPAPPRS